MPLSNPAVLELTEDEVREIRVMRWVVGDVDIRPPGDGRVLRVPAIRLFLAAEASATVQPYVDIVAKTLMDQLAGWLERPDFAAWTYTIRKYGEGPSARFGLTVRRV